MYVRAGSGAMAPPATSVTRHIPSIPSTVIYVVFYPDSTSPGLTCIHGIFSDGSTSLWAERFLYGVPSTYDVGTGGRGTMPILQVALDNGDTLLQISPVISFGRGPAARDVLASDGSTGSYFGDVFVCNREHCRGAH